jgi:5-methylthioadenosine/S-adenosylhomocysteine deaminase
MRHVPSPYRCARFLPRLIAGLAVVLALSHAGAAERLLIKNGLLMTMAPNQDKPFIGYIAVGADGRISAIGEGAPPSSLTAATTYDAAGKFITPGFISAHSHIWQSAFRGLAANQYVRGWSGFVYRQMAIQSAPEDFYWFTLHGSLDHLVHGITSVYNFTYGTRPGVDFSKHQWRGEIDSGVRFLHSYARPRDEPAAKQRADLLAFLDYAKPDMANPTFLKMSIAGAATSLEGVKLDFEWMKEFGMTNETHFLEWPLQKEQQQANFTNIVDAGIMGPDFSFGHFIHTTDPMLKAAAAAGSGFSWNPLSNGRLASGIADIPKYRSLGIKIGMGVDGQASADIPDPFENMRMGLYMIRAKYESALVLQPSDVLHYHTIGSAQVLNVADKVGSLEKGKFGDILVIDPKAIDRAPVFDAYATLVFACNVMNLEKVYVGGELVVENRKTLKHDFSKISGELAARVTRLNPPTPLP